MKNSKPPRRSKQAFLQLRDRSKKNDERVSPSAERSAAQRKEEEEQNEVDEKVDGLDKVRSEEGAWVQEIRKGVERLQEEKGAAERLGWQVQQLREDMSRLIQQQGPGRPPALYPQFSTSSRPQPHTQSHSRHGGGVSGPLSARPASTRSLQRPLPPPLVGSRRVPFGQAISANRPPHSPSPHEYVLAPP